ncbi:uncharacterized protein ACIBXB_009721 isoform 1-T7 [Morphnus guianensis]
MNKCLPFTKICSPLPPHSQGKSVLPLLRLGSLEESNREREFSSPFTAGRVVEAFSPKQKDILYCHFYSRLCLETEQSYSSVVLLMRRNERSRPLYRSSGRLQISQATSRGRQSSPRPAGGGRILLFRPLATEGHQSLTVGAAGRARAPAGRLLRLRGEGRGGCPQRLSPGGASVTSLRGGLEAGLEAGLVAGSAGECRQLLTAPAAGVCRLPGRRFEACSCCPPPRSVASRRVAAVEPGEEQRQRYAAFGRLPGGREERSGVRLRAFLGKFLMSPHTAVGCCPPSPSSLRVPQPPANFFCAYLF